MKMRPGEVLIDRLDSIEDTKGNSGDRGRMLVTNLRIIWHSLTMQRVSLCESDTMKMLSLIFSCQLLATVVSWTSPPRLSTPSWGESPRLSTFSPSVTTPGLSSSSPTSSRAVPGCSLPSSEYTSQFTYIESDQVIIYLFRAFNSSKMYRELKLRGAILENKNLKLLPVEEIVSTVNGVWNLSRLGFRIRLLWFIIFNCLFRSDQGNLGTMIITNVRVVWYANMNDLFNISIPYIQIASVCWNCLVVRALW